MNYWYLHFCCATNLSRTARGNKHNCVNPFSPGLMDLPRLVKLIKLPWYCDRVGKIEIRNMSFHLRI